MKEILILNGFGDKNTVAGIYIDGKLWKELDEYELPEEDSAIWELLKKLAKSSSVKFKEQEADFYYSLQGYYEPPGNLEEYQANLKNFYSTATFDSFNNDYNPYINRPYRDSDEEHQVYKFYGTSGGDLEHFNAWHEVFKKSHNGSFMELHEEDIMKVDFLFNKRDGKESTQKTIDELNNKLQVSWLEHLRQVWDAEKPLTTTAKKYKKQ